MFSVCSENDNKYSEKIGLCITCVYRGLRNVFVAASFASFHPVWAKK